MAEMDGSGALGRGEAWHAIHEGLYGVGHILRHHHLGNVPRLLALSVHRQNEGAVPPRGLVALAQQGIDDLVRLLPFARYAERYCIAPEYVRIFGIAVQRQLVITLGGSRIASEIERQSAIGGDFDIPCAQTHGRLEETKRLTGIFHAKHGAGETGLRPFVVRIDGIGTGEKFRGCARVAQLQRRFARANQRFRVTGVPGQPVEIASEIVGTLGDLHRRRSMGLVLPLKGMERRGRQDSQQKDGQNGG